MECGLRKILFTTVDSSVSAIQLFQCLFAIRVQQPEWGKEESKIYSDCRRRQRRRRRRRQQQQQRTHRDMVRQADGNATFLHTRISFVRTRPLKNKSSTSSCLNFMRLWAPATMQKESETEKIEKISWRQMGTNEKLMRQIHALPSHAHTQTIDFSKNFKTDERFVTHVTKRKNTQVHFVRIPSSIFASNTSVSSKCFIEAIRIRGPQELPARVFGNETNGRFEYAGAIRFICGLYANSGAQASIKTTWYDFIRIVNTRMHLNSTRTPLTE